MPIPGWTIVLTAAWGGALYWFAYHLVVQNGRILVRLDALENALKGRVPAGPFRVGNRFEADNVYGPIVYLDEYRLSGCRFDPDDVIIDVGAHIGIFSYLCYTKGSRAIHCFEPSDRNFEWLQSNLGSLPGIHLSRAAVWRSDCEQPAELTISGPAGENTGANSVLAGGQCIDFAAQTLTGSSAEKRPVGAIPLDQVLERFDRVKVLKIDCEGSEFPILLTSRQLNRVERIVGEVHEIDREMMELLDPGSRVAGYASYRVEDLVSRLQSLGFSVEVRAGQKHMYLLDARRDPG
jgi:FkbM family methyltransferase